jgi:hypothetical protein
MRFIISPASVLMAFVLSGCSWLPFSSNTSAADAPAPNARSVPQEDFGGYPADYMQRIVTAFQAKWPRDPIYAYRFEQPRRVQNTYSGRYGYAVRFQAQRPSANMKFEQGYPWVAFFEYGKIVWVQRDSEVAKSIKWYDGPQKAVEWSPSAAAK